MIDENAARPLGEEDGPNATTERDNTPEDTTESAENPILKAALRNAAQGLASFPCDANRKPRFKGWPELASTNPAQIETWLRRWLGTWLGVATGEPSRAFVLDVDMKNGKNGKASLAALEAKYGPLPVTLTATTPNGGRHYYFRYVPGFGNSTSELAPGLDIKTARGYVITPPSPGYIWDNEGTPIAEAPPWLIQLLIALKQPRKPSTQTADVQPCPPVTEATPYGRASMAGIVDEMKRAEPGTRNDTLNRLSFRFGQLVSGGQLPENTGEELKAAAAAAGLGADEIERTFQSGFSSGLKEPYTPASCAFADGSDIGAEIARLAGLSPLEYERIRKAEAKRLNIRPGVLDAAVKAAGQEREEKGKLPFAVTEPWASPVDPGALLAEIAATVRRFVVCSQEIADTVALWSAMTYVMDAVNVAPLLIITAPERQCGKTVLLSLIGRLAARAIAASNISPSSLFRAIEKWAPTLLLDECDAFLKENEALRGLINSGHTRDSAFTLRTVGDEFEPTRFSTWGAKVLCGIGRLPGTLEDRAIILELRRKLPGERVERMGQAEPGLFDGLRSKLARFSADFQEQVREARPPLLESLTDRQMDNWGSLLKIAMTAGGGWPERCATVALTLSGKAEANPAIGTQLLESIRKAFETAKTDRLDTAGLLMALCADAEAPWRTFNRGQPITPRQIAAYLKGYGIVSGTIRTVKGATPKGYYLKSFKDAFKRYLPEKNNIFA